MSGIHFDHVERNWRDRVIDVIVTITMLALMLEGWIRYLAG